VQTLDEVRQADSIEAARQSASQALEDAKQQAAGLLGQAGEYLSNKQQEQAVEQATSEHLTTEL
jgi:vacuolar-type H+-ATPase subunit H